MKKTLIALLALGGAAMGGTITLTPTSISTSEKLNGITATDVYGYGLNTWKGTWEDNSLVNMVTASSEGALVLQIGAAASNNSRGNYAAVRFATKDTPLTLSFDIRKSTQWGANLGSFTAQYSCTIYGYDAAGSETLLDTWTVNLSSTDVNAETWSKSATLNFGENAAYSSYGVIFHSMDTSTLGGGAGLATKITNIKVTTRPVPEPTTATLSLLALAGLAAKRRRK